MTPINLSVIMICDIYTDHWVHLIKVYYTAYYTLYKMKSNNKKGGSNCKDRGNWTAEMQLLNAFECWMLVVFECQFHVFLKCLTRCTKFISLTFFLRENFFCNFSFAQNWMQKNIYFGSHRFRAKKKFNGNGNSMNIMQRSSTFWQSCHKIFYDMGLNYVISQILSK